MRMRSWCALLVSDNAVGRSVSRACVHRARVPRHTAAYVQRFMERPLKASGYEQLDFVEVRARWRVCTRACAARTHCCCHTDVTRRPATRSRAHGRACIAAHVECAGEPGSAHRGAGVGVAHRLPLRQRLRGRSGVLLAPP
jgi:hypothetical protein